MAERSFNDVVSTLDAAFFPPEYVARLEAIREYQSNITGKRAWASVRGFSDQSLMNALRRLGLTPKTVTALTMVPLVEVAWADGTLDEKERKAIQQLAGSLGIGTNSWESKLLLMWLETRPGEGLRAAWLALVGALKSRISPENKAALRGELIGGARLVAKASGGVLGLGAVSDPEEEVLRALDAAFT